MAVMMKIARISSLEMNLKALDLFDVAILVEEAEHDLHLSRFF